MPTTEKQTGTESKKGAQFQKQAMASLNWPEVEKAKDDIKKTFGFFPTFMTNFNEQAIPGAWNEAKQLRFSEYTALDMKLKSLIALSVGSQIPCDMINYFEKKAGLASGISTQEQVEAATMTAILRHWSTVINGALIDKEEFREEVDKVMSNVKKTMEEMKGKTPDEEFFLVMPRSADEAYKDMEKTLGLVPQFFRAFPKDSIAAAWSEFKGFQLNPHTVLSGKQKELIGLAVAAQIPCEYCTYFHRAAAKLNGATELEIQEAVSLAAITRHWSAIFNSPVTDQSNFQKDADQMIAASLGRQIH